MNYTFLKNVVDFNVDVLTKGDDNEDVNMAVNSLLLLLKQGIVRMENHYDSEKFVLYELVDKLFQHNISSCVTLERRLHWKYVKAKFLSSDKVMCGNLGIGCNKTTWYGTIDVRLRGHSCSSTPLVTISYEDDEGEDSDGSSVVMEE